MNPAQVKTSIRIVVMSLLLATGFALSAIGTSVAAEPIFCSVGDFVWQCADGSETYRNDPEPPIPGHAGYGYFTSPHWQTGVVDGNYNVHADGDFALRFKTTQKWVSWWNTDGVMFTETNINGVVTIPSSAVIISVPGDIEGHFDLPKWIKGKLVSTGEYVLASTSKAKR